MAESQHVSGVDTVPPIAMPTSLFRSIKSVAQHITKLANTCVDYHAAAVLYEQLSGLSDAELHRRGFSRDTLAWDVCKSCDRTADR